MPKIRFQSSRGDTYSTCQLLDATTLEASGSTFAATEVESTGFYESGTISGSGIKAFTAQGVDSEVTGYVDLSNPDALGFCEVGELKDIRVKQALAQAAGQVAGQVI